MLSQHRKIKLANNRPRHNQQQGVVIVVALFIVALVATMAYVMMARLERDTRRTSLILHDTQAELFAQGSVAWAIDQLHNNWEKQEPKKIVDQMPMRSPEKNENNYHIISTLYDMQARYNVNNLALPEAQSDFKRLLLTVVPKISEEQAVQICNAIIDWIMPGGQHNEFSKYYLELPKPYRQSHTPLVAISELRLVKGMTADIFKALEPYITALPPPTAVNIQTAPAAVLITLGPTMTLQASKTIEQLRKTIPFITTEAFMNLDVIKNHPVIPDKITTTSTYFLVETEVAIEKQHIVLYTLLKRVTNAQKISVNVVLQSKGTW